MNCGEIYWVNLDPTLGDEIKKKRPVIILNEGDDKNLRLAIVVPVTGWKHLWERNPFFVTVEPTLSNGLKKKSVIDCYQIRAVSHSRFMKKIGQISNAQMNKVKRAIALILDIEPDHCD